MQSRAGEMSGLTTLVDRVRYWASANPQREAFVFRRHDGGRYPLTRDDYLRLATRFAARLQSLGLQPGDVVCNFLQNSPERVVTDLGIILSGAVPMNASPLLVDGADVQGCLRKGRARALLVDPDQKDGAWDVCQTVLHPCKAGACRVPQLPDLSHVLHSRRSDTGRLLLLEELESSSDQFHPVSNKADDVVYIFTTSGSTGNSKLIMHTNGSLSVCFELLRSTNAMEERDIVWNDCGLGWLGGFPLWHFTLGSTRVLSDMRAGAPEDMTTFVWNNLVQEKCTKAILFVEMVERIHERAELWKDSGFTLDRIMTGGQPVGRGFLKALTSSGGFAREFLSWYGSSELGMGSSIIFTADNQYEEFLVGNPSPIVTIKIVDENLRTVPSGTIGEVLVKTEAPFAGYLGDKEATEKAFTRDGWFRTDDLGYLDDRGRLYVMGRQSDAIMRGPFIVYPQWLEVRLRACPGVKDVVVVPVPDRVLYQEVCACVIREEGSDVSERDLDRYYDTLFLSGGSSEKTPKPKYFLFFDGFPLSKTHKTDRRQLAKTAAAKLELM